VFDRQKHYWIGNDETEKLLRNAQDWLPNHPEKAYITSRYLKNMRPLVNLALSRLISDEETGEQDGEEKTENVPEKKLMRKHRVNKA